eukprot:NODE_17544_length_937_cov_5.671605.p2 GENE.NODE_17544_length_937_cov_5.671605~~NODE_17544_length_937_cov_5.671605.p2  ORF type:complete len:183 (+),score=7.82 NODE_17544_length_937_cov_5.671605:114-662(+)
MREVSLAVTFDLRTTVLRRSGTCAARWFCKLATPAASCPATSRSVRTDCPLAMFIGMPHQHCTNTRKRETMYSDLPDNCFAHPGVCGGHQGHRCIAASEGDCIGNIYAIHCTCSSDASHQARLQMALRRIVESEFIVIRPPPPVLQRHERIAKHTVVRQEECVTRNPDAEALHDAGEAYVAV